MVHSKHQRRGRMGVTCAASLKIAPFYAYIYKGKLMFYSILLKHTLKNT